MCRKNLAYLMIATLLMAACGLATATPTRTPEPPTPLPPTASGSGVVSATPAPPGLEEPNAPPPPYAPAPGDDQLQRGNAFVDSAEMIVAESFPPQFFLHLAGSVPTPCDQLRVTVSTPAVGNRIDVEVYSVAGPYAACAQMLQTFDVNVRLGTFPTGKYEVWVNGQPVGEIEAP